MATLHRTVNGSILRCSLDNFVSSEHHSKAVDEIPVPDSTVSISSVLEVAVNLCVFQVQEIKNKHQTVMSIPKLERKKTQKKAAAEWQGHLTPLHFEATSFCLCLWFRFRVVVWLGTGKFRVGVEMTDLLTFLYSGEWIRLGHVVGRKTIYLYRYNVCD